MSLDHIPNLSTQAIIETLAEIERVLPSLPVAEKGLDYLHALIAARETFELIDELRDGAAHSVEIVCDNDDFNGLPNCMILVCGDWTNWDDCEFRGETVLECLRAAKAARDKAA